MEIKKFLELEKTFDNKSFEKRYGLLDKLLFICSWLGNAASIFFAFFFLNKLLYRATSEFTGRAVVFGLASVVILSLFELLKRYVLKNFSFAVIQDKKITTEVIYTLAFSLILLSGSFYLSLSGAKIFADKREKVEIQMKTDITTKLDSIDLIYKDKLGYKIKERDNIRESRDIYNEKIKSATYTSRLKEYNALITAANEELRRADKEIDRVRKEQERNKEIVKSEITSSSTLQVKQIFKNQIAFIIISSFIELLILVGIWFHSIFSLKVYQEFKNNIKNNSQYELYMDYSKMLSMLFQNGKIKPNDELPTMTSFTELIKKREGLPVSYIRDFINLSKTLGFILINRKKKNVAIKEYKDAKSTLLEYFEEE